MPISKPHTIRKYITPLNMNKLRGRMLVMPKLNQNAKTDFLLVYGQKSTIERWSVLANELRQYGNVVLPDLPGIGGMQSFYKIKEEPTIDNYADYLAAFVKLKFSRKKIVIVGMSFGFVVVTRMLQKYPELDKKVSLLINLSGFAHKNDIKLTSWQKKQVKLYAKLFSFSSTARLYRWFVYDEYIYKIIHQNKSKELDKLSNKEKTKLLRSEISDQKKNDTRTHMFVLREVMKLDNTKQTIDLPVWSLVGKFDEYLYAENVRSHLESIFSKYHEIKLKKSTHKINYYDMTPEYINNSIPYKLKTLLNRQNKQK